MVSGLRRKLRAAVPSISLTTDIIVGFPGETDAEFECSLDLARACGFSKIHVFPYSRREGTPAAMRSDQIPADVKAERARILRMLSNELRNADISKRIGTREAVLVEDDHALSESYHEVPIPTGAATGDLVETIL